MSALHQLTATRDAIATIVSVRRPRKNKRPVTQPRKRRKRILHHTNQHVFNLVSSHQGELRGFIPGRGWVRLQKRAVCQLLREAGPSAPAIVTLTVRQGVGYLTPVARSSENKTSGRTRTTGIRSWSQPLQAEVQPCPVNSMDVK
jgi:hypothetical protein